MQPEIMFTIFSFPVNDSVFFTWVVMSILIIASLLLTRNLKTIPSGAQHIVELAVDTIDALVVSHLGETGRIYTPFIITIGAFVFLANVIGVIPGCQSPTQDLSVTFTLAMIVLLVAHFNEIKLKGFRAYIKGYFSPYWIMFPLNIIGEFSKVLSHSFRLYGNIFGGAVILNILYMFVPFIVPIPIMIWFGVFMGAIQAYVFTLLALTYIQMRLE